MTFNFTLTLKTFVRLVLGFFLMVAFLGGVVMYPLAFGTNSPGKVEARNEDVRSVGLSGRILHLPE